MSSNESPGDQPKISLAKEAARASMQEPMAKTHGEIAQPVAASNRNWLWVGVLVFAGFFVTALAANILLRDDSSFEPVNEAASPMVDTPVNDESPVADSPDPTTGEVDVVENGIDPLTGEPYPESIADLSLAELRQFNYPRSVSLPDGRLALRGRSSSQERIDEAVAIVESVGGTAVVEVEVAPGFPEYERGRIFLENFILFDSNSTVLEPEFLPLLDGTLPAFEVLPDLVLTVVGFADQVGTAEDNLRLSGQRAQIIADYWIERGVAPERIIVEARGEPVSADGTPNVVTDQDRRVEFLMDFGS